MPQNTQDDAAVKLREKQFHDQLYSQESWETGPRKGAYKYYSTVRNNRQEFVEWIRSYGRGKDILEYGCGDDGYAFQFIQDARTITGIDISPVAVAAATERAAQLGASNMNFAAMDAEAMTFPDQRFDVVFGSGILHHLNIDRGVKEISRVLRPGGVAIFTEPMGHNPLINLYRRLTPGQRSPDEHPLRISDFRILEKYFGRVEAKYFNFFSILAVAFRSTPVFPRVLSTLEGLDEALFRAVPYLRRHAWMTNFICHNPKK